MLIVDIGNTNFHIYNGTSIVHLSHKKAIKKYKNKKLLYISVNKKINKKIKGIKKWRNISDKIRLNGEYSTMGVDRKALCLSKKNGIFIDAGSAITIDIMRDGIYQGGFILLGLRQYLKAYKDISAVLDIQLNENLSLNKLPKTTKDAISYGIISSIKAVISLHQKENRIYFSGGDGKFLSRFFKKSVYDEELLFKGIIKSLRIKNRDKYDNNSTSKR